MVKEGFRQLKWFGQSNDLFNQGGFNADLKPYPTSIFADRVLDICLIEMEIIRRKVVIIIICKLRADSSQLQITKTMQGNEWHFGN